MISTIVMYFTVRGCTRLKGHLQLRERFCMLFAVTCYDS
jgi:hypothetical protein